MSRSKELFMETRQGQQDVDEYFQWLKEEEWQQYLQSREEDFHRKYGYALTFRMKWAEYLKKLEYGTK